MLSVKFYDNEAMKKKYKDREGECLCVISGSEMEVMDVCDNIPEFWYSVEKSKNIHEAYIVLDDFSHFMDVVIYIQNHFNGVSTD